MPSLRPRRIQAVLSFLTCLCALSLAACVASPTQPPVAASPTPAETFTPAPTLTPTPQPGRVLLVGPGGDSSEAALVHELQPVLAALAQGEGLEFEVRPALLAGGLDPSMRVVVVVPPDPGIAALAAAAPETQFAAVGIPGLQPSANLSVIANPDSQTGQEAFLAGYVAALTAVEWRAGMLSQPGTPQGLAAQEAFLNGARYLCGLCNPKYPPYPGYPLAVELAEGGSEAAIQALAAKAVKTVYVDPRASTPELLDQLSQAGFQIVGSQAPAESLRPRWTASVRSDTAAALKVVWPDLIAGTGGAEVSAPLIVTDALPSALTPGRMRLVETLVKDLAGGWIKIGD